LGVALKLWSILIGLVLGFGAGFGMALGMPRMGVMMVVIAGGALGLWAIFLITAPEPMIGIQENPVTLRKFVRGTAVAGLIGSVLSQCMQIGGSGLGWVIFGGLSLSLAGIAAMFGEFVYLRRFAERIPDDKLALSTTTVMWGYIIMYAAVLIVGVFAAVAGLSTATIPAIPSPFAPFGGWLAVMTVLGCGFYIGMLVFAIWYIVLLFQYLCAFKREASAARIIYASDHPLAGPTV